MSPAAIYYAYPPSLCVTLLISHLLSFRQDNARFESPSTKSSYGSIWYLQALLLLTLAASIAFNILASEEASHVQNDSNLVQAQLACHIAIFLYFGSGLLPDPDGPFTPVVPNFYTWILAIGFEIVIITIARTSQSKAGDANIVTGIGGLRILLLIFMTTVFAAKEYRHRWKSYGTSMERESLIENGTAPGCYRASGTPEKTATRPIGWLAYFYGFRRLFPYMWPSDSMSWQLITIFCFILLILQRIINIMVPRQLGLLVDALGVGSIPYKDITLYCLYRGLQGQQGIINSVRAILWIPISQSLYSRLTSAAYEHVLLLSLDFHHSKRIGEVMSALGKGGALNTFLDGFAFQLFPMVFDLAVAAVYLFVRFDAFYSIIVVTVMWNYVFVTIYMAKYRGKARREMTKRDREMDAAKTDAIMAYETVHYNGALRLEIAKFKKLILNFQEAEFSVLFSLNGLNAVQNSIFILGILLVCLISANQISTGLHTVSDFITVITYFAQLQAPLAFFGSFYNQVQNNLVDAERMLELFNTKPDVVDSPQAKPIPRFSGRLTVSNLTFNYGVSRPAIDNISFQVEPGTSTAIVGESGSGKSTILKLLYRFYDLSSGQINVDGLDMQNITINSWRSYIGVVPQDTVLFNDLLMNNLLYARPEATQEEVFNACRAASIHTTILGFPEKYNTVVGERGLKLSGGERQRIAIARAILKNPQILLLDEATASLDTHTEKQIQESLEKVTKGRTTITIAHRLSTITQADQILVLHKGAIVERGTHAELMEMRGRYAAMWNNQTAIEEKEKGM